MGKLKSILAQISKKEIILLFWLIVIYQVIRLCFFIANYSFFKSLSILEIANSFFVGSLFDLSAIFASNSLLILIYYFPYVNGISFFRRFCMGLFVIVNSIAIFANTADIAYFRFVLKRTTSDIFSFIATGTDMVNLLPQFLKDFWYIFLLWFGLTLFLLFLAKRFLAEVPEKIRFSFRNLMLFTIRYTLILGISILFVRGGFGLRPMSSNTAANYVSQQAGPLVVNTPFSIMKTIGKAELEEKNYFDEKHCLTIYNPFFQPEKSVIKKNVVIIVLESFSKEYIGYFNPANKQSFTPFLDSLMLHSMVCTNAYANGRKSIEGLPAIIAGIPTLMDNPFITSMYSSNKFEGLASILKTKGYHASFFHGGTNGTLGLESFSKLSGFDKYYGRTEFANDAYYDGKWGIRDEEFLQFAVQTINIHQSPFVSVVYTLSSHHPYYVPAKYKNILPKGEIEILQSIAYADLALKKFFQTAQRQSWFKNTLFVFTADHAAEAMSEYYKSRAGSYAIPIVYYSPSEYLNTKFEDVTQQIDIMPSVMGYLGYDKPVFCFGKNIFSNKGCNFCINYIDNSYQLICANNSLIFDGGKTIGFYNLKKDSLQKVNNSLILPAEMKKQELFLKAFIQQYNNRLISNRLF